MSDAAERERLAQIIDGHADDEHNWLADRAHTTFLKERPELAEGVRKLEADYRTISAILRAPAVPEGWRVALEQALDRMEAVEKFKAGDYPVLPACTAAIAHAKQMLAAAPQPKEPRHMTPEERAAVDKALRHSVTVIAKGEPDDGD